jgi:UDP-N-acetylmuramate dehydrogenase
MILIEETFSLKSFNTFGIQAYAKIFAEATTMEDLISIIGIFRDNPLPKLILGGGSNLLFTKDFDGVVIFPNLVGIELVRHSGESTWLRAYAGENWDKFVEFCVSKNLGGIENLSFIPGNIGACPIQNIGAYGVEVKDVIESVDALDIQTGDKRTFSNEECQFGYRDSIFKNEAKNKYIITSVVFKLRKQPAIFLSYKEVMDEIRKFPDVTVANVRQSIINIRRRKLPDPAEFGNAGSFFKNPLISTNKFQSIKEEFSLAPSYIVDKETVKIPAAWLIETCGWKGIREGNVGTHPNQPLVIVNYNGAKGRDVIQFAEKISNSVKQRFGIELQMEVNVI